MNHCVTQTFGWCEEAWLLLDQIGILAGLLMISLSLTGALVAWFRKDHIKGWFRQNRFPHTGGLAQPDAHWDTLIFTISRDDVPAWVIDQIKPKVIGLLATAQSREAAEKVKTYAGKHNITSLGPYLIDDPDDPAAAKTHARQLLQDIRALEALPNQPADQTQHATKIASIAIDITGGKVPMSLGAFMAAEEAGADTLYVSTKYINGKPDLRSASIRCISQPVN